MDRYFLGHMKMVVVLAALTILTSGCETEMPGPPLSATQAKSTSESAKATSLPDWKPMAALLDELGPYQDVEGFQIRAPKEYELTEAQSLPIGGKAFAWSTPLDENDEESHTKSRPALVVVVFTPPPGSPDSKATLTKMLSGMMPSFKQNANITKWTQTPPESGKIGNIPFKRIGWQGLLRGVKARGSIYVGKDSGSFITMFIGDADPASRESMKLLTASVLTCRKK